MTDGIRGPGMNEPLSTKGSLQPRIPCSTYRLQFNRGFTFSDAKKIVPYLHELGITDVYASSYLKAKAGSLHGYDVVDPRQLNPEIGTREEYLEFVDELHRYGMGQILDIVPNHMCVSSNENGWWMDILENGPSSPYASFFDIDWNPVKKELRNKVLLPILGRQYGTALENGELRLAFREGRFFVMSGDLHLPVRPQTYAQILKHRLENSKKARAPENPGFAELLSIVTALGHLPPPTERDPEKIKERYREKEIIKKRLWGLYRENAEIKSLIDENVVIFNGRKGEPESFDLLDRLLDEQIYRLSFWRVAADEINYRRFFDVNDLAAIRTEDPRVFEETHRLIFALIQEGNVTGLRVDHPDGLYDPLEYFNRLQRRCSELIGTRWSEGEGIPPMVPETQRFYIVVEKILTRGERMPEGWPIYSTTGYVFLNSVNGVFIQPDHAKAFDRIYSRFIKGKMDYQETVYEKKKLIMQIALSSEIHTLGRYLERVSEKDRYTRDFTRNSLTAAMVEVIACFPVYRTYINSSGINERDRKYTEIAVSRAKRKNPAISESVFDFLLDVLVLNYPEKFEEEDRTEWLEFVMRFQQVTGPVMAKGAEDTASYVYNRFVSLNEVGGSPDRFGTSLETFHGQNIERCKFWPHAMISSSTHDSKRNEDVRARINVLSELPDEWKERLAQWSRLNKKKKQTVDGRGIPEPNEEYLLYQTLIGTWPIGAFEDAEYESFKKRIQDYMIKAAREAKVNTSWVSPNGSYEKALTMFVERIMEKDPSNSFLAVFEPFQKKISDYGMFNSLSLTLLKATSPGVPDFYQGTEIWDFSLVDPDNRRPVDYDRRTKMLEVLKQHESKIPRSDLTRQLMIQKDNPLLKLYLTYQTLNCRREHRELFEKGDYYPLEVRGEKSDHVCAFERRANNFRVVIIAPRFYTGLISSQDGLPLGLDAWKDTAILIPSVNTDSRFHNVFTGEQHASIYREGISVLKLSEVLANFPVALLECPDAA